MSRVIDIFVVTVALINGYVSVRDCEKLAIHMKHVVLDDGNVATCGASGGRNVQPECAGVMRFWRCRVGYWGPARVERCSV